MNGESKPTILVVEDENVVAMDLVSSLEKLGYRIAGVADTGERAIALARSKAPGIVLMDIHLRGEMDGIAAAQRIQDEMFVPVVFLTAYSDEPTLARARITQPFGYVLKPFEDREIEVAIQMATFRHSMERALRASEQRLDAILGAIGDAVVATDSEQRITFLNGAAERLLGWSAQRARGRLLTDVLRISPAAEGVLHLARGAASVPVEIVESPVPEGSSPAGGRVTVIRDLSERLRAQESHDRALIERAARASAERESERTRLKSDISAALADITRAADMDASLRRVAELVVASLASSAVLDTVDRDREVRVVAHAESAAEGQVEELLRCWQRDPMAPSGPSAVMRTGAAELIAATADGDLATGGHDPALVRRLRELGIHSTLCVPLRARRRVIGALSLASSRADRSYDASDLAFAQQIADRVGLAIDNLMLYREAEEARATAERLYLAERVAHAEAQALFRIADAIAAAQLDQEQVIQRVTDEATALVGAEFGAFFYNVVSESGEAYTLYTLSGAPREAFEKFGLPRKTPLFAPTFSGERVVRLDDVRADPRYGAMPPHHGMPKGHLPVTSYLAVPVVSRAGVVIGGLFFGHPERARFTEEHERTATALAAHAALAIDNARLFSAMREAEERQSKLVRELERAVRFSEMFVGVLGHDLRNPLSGITTAASLVLQRADSDRLIKPVTRILRSADRMSRMIDQILDFTQVRLGRGIRLARKSVDVSEIARTVLDELRDETTDRDDLRLELHGDPIGTWDPDRLAQLLSNLAGNAIQHRAPGSKVRVTIDGSADDRVVLAVLNAGVIPADVLPAIFEPLRGAEPRKRAGSSGLGLGLYISAQIVNAHGGEIRVSSDEASGTRFEVCLPRHATEQAAHVFNPSDADPRAT